MSSFLLLAFLLQSVSAHNWLIYPQPRTPGKLYGGTSLEAGNCENIDESIPDINTFQRGQRISAQHTYANHVSGFVRFSIVPMNQSTSVEAMNDPVNFIRIGCHTNQCGGRVNSLTDAAYDYFKPYNLPEQSGIPLDFVSPASQYACNTSVTFPSHLADGSYALQWMVYGMRGNFQPHPETMALPFYRNCANIRIAGGSAFTKKPRGKSAKCQFEWSGGDRTLSTISDVNDIDQSDLDTSQCSYWRHNAINATQNYYNPPGFWAMGEAGLPYNDQTALRAGPPAEVLACGKRMKSFTANNSSSLLSDNATYPSTNATLATNATVLKTDMVPEIQPNLSERATEVKCAKSKHAKRRKITFGKSKHD